MKTLFRRFLTLPLLLSLGAAFLSTPASALDRPDGWITLKVKTRLLTKGGMDGTDINVDTNEGRVTLHGTVSSEAERMRVVEEARHTEGVLEVSDLLAVVPEGAEARTKAHDDGISRQVVRRLKTGGRPLAEVHVKSVHNGKVLLTGETPSEHDRLEAITLAGSTPGVREVGSNVEVDGQGDSGLSESLESIDWSTEGEDRSWSSATVDSWITTKTKIRLLSDPDLPGTGINVDTRQGYVTLFGVVDDRRTAALAEREALDVDGVAGVRNHLQVVAHERQKANATRDSQIAKRIEARLEGQPGLSDVSVEVEGGAVRLTGTVPSHERQLRALRRVRTTAGVSIVINDVRVQSEQG